jgi:23S rRNA (cytidine2498-2'-O)-methyltransferase
LVDRQRSAIALIAHCRAGFEPEAAADLVRLAAHVDEETAVDAPVARGFVVAPLRAFDAPRWLHALERSPPIFARSLFVGTGPHRLLDTAATRGRPDRIAPLIAQITRFCAESPLSDLMSCARQSHGYTALRLETPDTNDGKELSGLARALAARLADGLRAAGVMAAANDSVAATQATNLHVLLPDGAQAYVGASVAPWASPWPMGIPRLRMPGGAPSRSTLKLAEAFVTFLGDRESGLLRPGMRAIDLGAAPGGWTWQLAHRGVRVTAVDNGPLKGAIRDDPLVTHLRADGLSYLPKRPVDWMVCDIVEQPSRIAALVARWIGEGHARNAIFNLKLPMKKRYDEVRRCEAIIRVAIAGARVKHTLALRQLYHDREEVTGCVVRSAEAAAPSTPRRR